MSDIDDSVLQVMLQDFSKDQLIEVFIATVKVICGDNKEALKGITHGVISQAHLNRIMAGKSKLEDYDNEEHRRELFKALLCQELRRQMDEATANVFYEDYKKSGLPFKEWKKTLHDPT